MLRNRRRPSKLVAAAHPNGYQRGLRYRQELQNTGGCLPCDACRTLLWDAVRLLPLTQIDSGFGIADDLAQEYGIDRRQIPED